MTQTTHSNETNSVPHSLQSKGGFWFSVASFLSKHDFMSSTFS